MSRFISETLRLFVFQRANFCCEYCRVPQVSIFIKLHIEHIKSLKHGGKTDENNLASSCSSCDFFKGSDLGTFLDDDNLTRFFNPRKDIWDAHFEISEGVIYSKTSIGEATVRIFQFNTPERIILRKELFSK